MSKKHILTLCINIFFANTYLFAQGQKLIIEDSIKFSQKITTKETLYQTKLTINYYSNAVSNIKREFDNIIKSFKQGQNICYGGNYNIVPQYGQSKNPKKFIRYFGQSAYKCIFDDIAKYDKVIAILNAQKKAKYKYTFGQIKLYFTMDTIQKYQNILKDRAYKYSIWYESHLSNTIKKKCKTSNVSFAINNFQNKYENLQSLNAHYKFICS